MHLTFSSVTILSPNLSLIRLSLLYYLLGFTFHLLLPSQTFSQLPNDSIYQHLLHTHLSTDSLSIRAIKGSPVTNLFPDFPLDTLSNTLMVVSEPGIVYKKLTPKTFTRELSIMIQYQDSLTRRQPLSYIDTLTKRQLKTVRKLSSPELKGDNPTIWGKWLKPSTLIITSVGVIFSLFYLRSN